MELQRLIDQIEVAVITTDTAGRVTRWNRHAEVVFGRSRDEAVGHTIHGLLGGEGDVELADRIRERLLAGESWKGELDVAGADGDVATVLVRISPLHEPDGGPAGFVAVSIDISDRKRTEALAQVAEGIADDFNNLLAVIINYAALASEELEPGSRAAQHVAEVVHAGEQAAHLTGQLLTLGRPDPTELEPVDLCAVIGRSAQLLERTLGDAIQLRVVMQPIPPVMADPARIEQVLLNLALNARDAMPGGGVVTIETEERRLESAEAADLGVSDHCACLTFRDTGKGMTAEVLTRAMEPFFSTKPAGRGLGLGLATIHAAVKEIRGAVTLDSAPGEGTRIRLLIPAVAGVVPPADQRRARPPRIREGKRILLAEDEDGVRGVTREVLEASKGRSRPRPS